MRCKKAVLLGALVLEMERNEGVVAEWGSRHGEAPTLRREGPVPNPIVKGAISLRRGVDVIEESENGLTVAELALQVAKRVMLRQGVNVNGGHQGVALSALTSCGRPSSSHHV